MDNDKKPSDLLFIFFIFLSWILISRFTPFLNRIFDFRKIHLWILPAIRMTLMFLVTYFYVKFYEKKSFSEGFHFSFQRVARNLLWAFVFALIDSAAVMGYLFLIVKPLTQEVITASGAVSQPVPPPFWSRLLEYFYIVYEGIIEVFIFIGFLFDRLLRRWNWPLALIVANLGFALWHFNYWSKGLLEGSLMIILTFISGTIHSLNYMKTKNSLSPAICHFLTDSPSAIRILLGIMH